MKTLYLTALAATLVLSAASRCCARPAPNRGARRAATAKLAKPASTADWVDIRKWPAYRGAELVQQVFLSAEQLKALSGQVPPEARLHLRGLKQVAILDFRLPDAAVAKDVIAFYEPRALAAGYKLLLKNLSDPGEEEAVYVRPNVGTLVVSLESEGENHRQVEIVSVKGPLGSLVALREATKKGDSRSSKPAPASPSRTRGTSGTGSWPTISAWNPWTGQTRFL
jgi:hypothetical protein